MKHTTISVLTVFVAIFSFNFNSIGQQSYETVELNGTTREYYQYLPVNYDPGTESLPVVFLLHGLGGNALNTSSYGMNPIADTARFIAVYPQGLSNGSQNAWNNGTLLSSSGEDVLFISSLIDTLNAEQNIDLSRVYMSGISMGSIMTYTLCRHLSDRIAAAGCLIGTMSTDDINNFNPAFPVPTLHKHGTNDATVPYSAPALPSLSLVQQTIDQLKVSNGFQGDSTVTTMPDLASDGITIDKIVYNCTTPVELWRMNNADHVLLFEPLNDTNTTEMLWSFFAQYTHPNPSTAGLGNLQELEIDFYPNPAKDVINIINHKDFSQIEIYSIDGKLHSTFDCSAQINVQSLESGTYIFRFLNEENQGLSQRIFID